MDDGSIALDHEEAAFVTALAASTTGRTSKATRIVFVEDDDCYRQAMEGELTEQGFAVHPFADGAPMLEAVGAGLEADIVLLDWKLASAPGLEVFSELRRIGVEWPVVFLTGHNSPLYESRALQQGAADYVEKSRSAEVLGLRIRLAASRRGGRRPKSEEGKSEEGTYHCGHLSLRSHSERAYWDGTDLKLTTTEFEIVYLLASHVGTYVTYRQIYDCMRRKGFFAGNGEHGYRTNVRSAIRRVRDKFRALFPGFDEIHNYTSYGYCWGKALPIKRS